MVTISLLAYLILEVASDSSFVFSMNDFCGRALYLGFASDPSGRLEYVGDGANDTEREGDCMAVIEPGILRDRIAFHFEEMALPPGLCVTIKQRMTKRGAPYAVSGVESEHCGNHSLPVSAEFKTDQDAELLVTLSGTNTKGARIILIFTLYNEKELKAICNRFECNEDHQCNSKMECLYGYTPCDFHECAQPEADALSDRKLTHLQIYGIVFGILIGLSICMCRFAIKSSDIKNDILNRVHSFHRNEGQAARAEEPDCRDANRYHSFVLEELIQGNRLSRHNSSDLELRRSPSDPTADQFSTDHETTRFITRHDGASSFSAIVECNFHYSASSPRISRHCSRPTSRNTSRHVSRSNSRQGSRSNSRQASRSGSRQASRNGSPHHVSRSDSPVNNYSSAPDIVHVPLTTSRAIYSDQYTPPCRRSLHDLLHDDLPPSFSSVVASDADVRRRDFSESVPTSLTDFPNADEDISNHRSQRGIDISGYDESTALEPLSAEENSPGCLPPTYEEVIAHEEKYNIKPA